MFHFKKRVPSRTAFVGAGVALVSASMIFGAYQMGSSLATPSLRDVFVDVERLELGALSPGITYTFDATIINQSDEVWHVTSVTPDCGCIFAAQRHYTVPPGQRVEIPLTLQTPMSSGSSGSHLSVNVLYDARSDSGQSRRVTQTIVGDVIPAIRAIPGRLSVSDALTRTIHLFGPKNLLSQVPDAVVAKATDNIIRIRRGPDSETVTYKPVVIHVEKRLVEQAPAGWSTDIQFVTDDESILLRVPLEIR